MWKQILSKVNAALLAHWSQFVWFVLGVGLGLFVLGSCVAVENTKSAIGSVDDSIRDVPVLGAVYAIPSDVVSGVYGLGEDLVEGTVDLVTTDECCKEDEE